ncbi:hypothetical protein B7H23_06655 [Notoacmeibacter marinus]|uniref:ATP synthase F0 subunit B n=1 Tax=Notoacmeibacter marinus TaxID=1876515 RepID=A0A231V4P5_9HYPH|nr:hypothetical protein [Notoacmeibacter marinus]OXT02566.1 hypothetical protein B7H23_06655 [Notoacmeibacter marinus]
MPQDPRSGPAADKAKADAENVKQAAQREADAASAEASKVASDLKSEASNMAEKAKQEGLNQAERGKDVAASTVEDFAASIRAAADKLGERDQSMSANLVREAARGLEDVSGAISGRSVGEIVNSVSGFARNQPTAFLVGAALTGVALGRFARASSAHSPRDYGETPPPPAPYTGTGGVSPTGGATTHRATSPSTPSPSASSPSSSTTPTSPSSAGSPKPSPSTTVTSSRTPSSGGTISGGTSGPIGQPKKGQ